MKNKPIENLNDLGNIKKYVFTEDNYPHLPNPDDIFSTHSIGGFIENTDKAFRDFLNIITEDESGAYPPGIHPYMKNSEFKIDCLKAIQILLKLYGYDKTHVIYPGTISFYDKVEYYKYIDDMYNFTTDTADEDISNLSI